MVPYIHTLLRVISSLRRGKLSSEITCEMGRSGTSCAYADEITQPALTHHLHLFARRFAVSHFPSISPSSFTLTSPRPSVGWAVSKNMPKFVLQKTVLIFEPKD